MSRPAQPSQNPLLTRIDARIAEMGLSRAAVSRAAGMEADGLRNLARKASRTPRSENLLRIADVLECDVRWLLTGDDRFRPPPATPRPKTAVRRAAAGREPVAPAQATPAESAIRDIPVMGTAAGAVIGAFHLQPEVIEYAQRPPALAGARDVYAVYVRGNSMVPEHRPGDLRFISPHRPVRPGDSVVLQVQNYPDGPIEAYIKTFVREKNGEIIVEQHNPPGQITFKREHIFAMHRVLTMGELFGL